MANSNRPQKKLLICILKRWKQIESLLMYAEAEAKISCRLIAGQDPEKALEAVRSHIEKHTPKGLQMEISGEVLGGSALRMDPDTASIKRAGAVLEKITGEKPVFLYEGASIPIIPSMAEATGAGPVLVGFGTEEGRAHAPNESFGLDDFRLGYLYACEMLASM